jgi:DNA repair exonuclease SbcCD nuclease subunit
MVNGKMWDRMCQEKLNTLRKLPGYAEKLKVDAVLIAGDVFDTSNPPEALKAELVKILKMFTCPVNVITGRPGDHDYVNENNYVMMDIKEALDLKGKVYIHNSNFLELSKGVLAYHDMLEGISDLYKNVVKLNDEKFIPYRTILMGDYHAKYWVEFGRKWFFYPGPPYPTRYGEQDHGFLVVETNDGTGAFEDKKYYQIKTYELLSSPNLEESGEALPYVMRYELTVPAQEIPVTLRACEERKRELTADPNCMDVIWKVKASNPNVNSKGEEMEDLTLKEVCLNYIQDNAGKMVKGASALFSKLEKAVD